MLFKISGLEFKTPELEREWQRAGWIDARLRAIDCYFAFYCWTEFKKNWIITQISRTDQEQIRIYPEYFRIYQEVKSSKHLIRPGRRIQATDHRSTHLVINEILELKKVFLKYFGGITEDALFKYHQGTALHVHIQV